TAGAGRGPPTFSAWGGQTGAPRPAVFLGPFFSFFFLSSSASPLTRGAAPSPTTRAGNTRAAPPPPLLREKRAPASPPTTHRPPGKIFKGLRKPSYIPSHVFALTLLDTFAPPSGDVADDHDLIKRAERALGPPVEGSESRPNEIVRGLIRDALAEASNDVDRFR